jgi:hypothetical protein
LPSPAREAFTVLLAANAKLDVATTKASTAASAYRFRLLFFIVAPKDRRG